MFKRVLKKIPGVLLLYVMGRRFTSVFIRKCNCLASYQKKLERQNFERNVEKWNFDQSFSDLIILAAYDRDYLENKGNKLIKENNANPKGYALIQACLNHKPEPNHYNVGLHSLAIGNELVSKGRLKEARDFFLSLQKIFPEIYEPYAILYNILYLKQEEYRAAPTYTRPRQKKSLLLSFSLWGDKYIQFFNDYCIPCMMAEGNLPAVSKRRSIYVDLYAHREDILKLKELDMFESFSALCEINFIEFPKHLVTCEGYKGNDAAFRYNIYGGFHHLSIERARSMEADIICLGPDNIYSDGSFLNYVKFIDEGYSAVLFTSTRAQAEFLLPVLDTMKNPSTKALSITSDEMVEFSAQYINHNFLQYIVTDDMTPVWRSGFFIPYNHGFYIRAFHYHPVIISSAALDRSKDFHWNYTTADCNLITVLFPDKKEWDNIKVITDSKDGIMLDVAYASPGMHHQDTTAFNEEYMDKTRNQFNENQYWNFKFIVNYRMDKEMSGVRAYIYDKEQKLIPKEFPLTVAIEDIRTRINNWYDRTATS